MNGHTILSAFGNAKTVHNDNSSRFGKYINLHIDGDNHQIKYYTTKTYLLEKNRVVDVKDGDRSYHIFYALMKCLTPEEIKKYNFVEDFSEYNYMRNSVNTDMNPESKVDHDKNIFNNVLTTFGIFGLEEEEIDSVWTLISLILAIGNLSFEASGEYGKARGIILLRGALHDGPRRVVRPGTQNP